MTNAAIFMHPDGFDTGRPNLLGRHAAGESFLRGFIRHADVERFYFWQSGGTDLAPLAAAVQRLAPTTKPTQWFAPGERQRLAEAGVVNLPGPHLNKEAWLRRPYGGAAYSVCGLTHTTATARTMDDISNFLIAPVEGHDALICTSTAVRASVEAQLEGVRDYFLTEYGATRLRPEPLLATIPLGVNADDFATRPEHRKVWRQRLDIPEDAVVALYVGRFNIQEKMNPALMALALERAVQDCGQPIYWVNAGWAGTDGEAAAYHDNTRALCPSVQYRTVDGRPPETRFTIWSVADFFISFSDNIQESFGLTPVEAMAAGLPCVVTDWDGYRDTVRDGEDGFRIDTAAPRPGDGFDFAYWHANGWWSYTAYVGAAAQLTAIDFAQATQAISALATNPDLRRRLGAQAQARARSVFDWSAVVPQYQALWAEQNARRGALESAPPVMNDPFRPDPFRLYASYPTRHPAQDWRVTLSPGMTWPAAKAVLSSPLATYGAINRPTVQEVEQLLAWLETRPEGGALSEVAELFPAGRRPAISRGVLWIARFGVIELRPPA
ncbi:MAG TPA: glycosyltransferase family 4 protein [Phenylobacterium sp.]|jgi:glycosyltransferase involved in cell wall biosynthesis|uniref:glycosyltransferase family 4 protein n=1 Tax=Phenylobacterium sp. TaxID=1871053 RepID=UPI002D382670|nr:glycosyltransferase family 4 protein [Phenylobacterium sp.]HZZ70347.1 glycosyltransferase family 4 protein [Phenylobacterium sp.]